MESKPAHQSQAVLSELALPNDANGLGAVLGGKIMHLVDIAGAIAAARHCRGFVVTASCDHMDFLQPVHIGELIILRASVNRAFRTSMEVGVKVFAEDLRGGEIRHVASAYLTFVALDDERRPVPVPPLVPESEQDKRRYEQAGARRAYRLGHRNRNAPPPSQTSPSKTPPAVTPGGSS
jgi:acyl-CoA hydrolase